MNNTILPDNEVVNDIAAEAAETAKLPPLSLDEKIKLELLELAERSLDELQIEVAIKDIYARTKIGIKRLKSEYARIKVQVELKKQPPLPEPSPEEKAAHEAQEQRLKEHKAAVDRAADEITHNINIPETFRVALKKTGYIAGPVLAYTICLSHVVRLLSHCSGFLLRGASGSGKTDGWDKGALFLPDEVVRRITSASQQALYYMGDLSGQYLMFGEMSPNQNDKDADDYRQSAMRQLISDNRLSRNIVEKVDGRTNSLSERITKGPCVIVGTTTAEPNRFNNEFINRISCVNSDEDEETTNEVLRLQASAAEEPWKSEDINSITEPWQEFHRRLQAHPVIVPFAKWCIPTVRHVTVRRLNKLLIMYIKGFALLHQATRKTQVKNGKSYLIATIEDYRFAYDLLSKNAPRTLETVSRGAQEALVMVKKLLDSRNQNDEFVRGEISLGEIQQALQEPETNVWRWMTELANAGFLNRSQYARKNYYSLGSDEEIVQQEIGLIPPDEVEQEINLDGL